VASSYENYRKAVQLRQGIAAGQKELEKRSPAAGTSSVLKDLDQKTLRLQGSEGGFGGGGRGARQAPSFAALNRNLGSLATVVDGQDAAPTPAMQTAYEGYCRELATVTQSWNDLIKADLAAANGELAKQGLSPLAAATVEAPACK